jgi:hypothetical protein
MASAFALSGFRKRGKALLRVHGPNAPWRGVAGLAWAGGRRSEVSRRLGEAVESPVPDVRPRVARVRFVAWGRRRR